MKYINQLQLRHVAYETNVLHGGRPPESRNIATNGCGICATCMMVELLTDKELPVEECVQISYDTVANHKPGTDLDRLSPAVAERFDLDYEPTDDLDEVIDALRCGGKVIIHVQKGLFTAGGHYMLLVSYDGEDFCILDPSYKPTKFATPEREGRVDESHVPFLYYNARLMHEEETSDKYTKYHIFRRKK